MSDDVKSEPKRRGRPPKMPAITDELKALLSDSDIAELNKAAEEEVLQERKADARQAYQSRDRVVRFFSRHL